MLLMSFVPMACMPFSRAAFRSHSFANGIKQLSSHRLNFSRHSSSANVYSKPYASLAPAASNQDPKPNLHSKVTDSTEFDNRRPLRKGDIIEVTITRIAYGGASVGKIVHAKGIIQEDLSIPVYAPKGACPGDVVRCQVKKVRRKKAIPEPYPVLSEIDNNISNTRTYAEAHFAEKISSSSQTADIPCIHFGHFRLGGGGCGGCASMNIPYHLQIQEKQDQMTKLFAKLCSANNINMMHIIPCNKPLNYRNKMEFSFGRRWYTQPKREDEENQSNDIEYSLGLHAPQRFDKIVHIEKCHIQADICNEILSFIRQATDRFLLPPYDPRLDEGYLRSVALRSATNGQNQQEIMVNLITSSCDVPQRLVPLAMEIAEKFPMVVCVVQNICGVKSSYSIDSTQERLLVGTRSFIEQKLGGLVFRISANSFFQTNSEQAEVLYKQIREVSQLSEEDLLLDLFCGTGSIGLSLADQVKEIHGVDIAEAAIEDAIVNAQGNQITNARFYVGNLDKLKKGELPSSIGNPNVIIVDPPRAGLHPDLIKFFSKATTLDRIIYVSCNPVSQLRDIEMLQSAAPGQFRVTHIQPLDMFPHTNHMECVARIDRINH